MPNHLSNADGPVIDRALREKGPIGFADNIVYIQGRKLDLHPINSYFTKSLKVIKIWPQTIKPTIPEEEQLKRMMNAKAMEDSKKCLQAGYFLCVFFEGGRSYNGRMKEAERSALQLFTLVEDSETLALPIGIWKTEKIMPPEKLPRFLPMTEVNVNIGKPINVTSLIRATENSGLSGARMRKKVVDGLMRQGIASLLPPNYRGFYA